LAAKKKYYVVWHGYSPGIYDNWEDAKRQVTGFPCARYKSFETFFDAREAFQNPPSFLPKQKIKTSHISEVGEPIAEAIAVDAACSKNPGLMEYQGVWVANKQHLFRQGPFPDGTNNIGEFLAIVHALALCKKQGWDYPIYSDSKIAILWVKNQKAKTKMLKSAQNSVLFDLIERAEFWLKNNSYSNQVLKWETSAWGEIPADFGRK